MADHFVGFSRGIQGEKYSDFTTGTSTTGGLTVELRVTDSTMTIKDVVLALEAFERFMENRQQWATAGFLFLNN